MRNSDDQKNKFPQEEVRSAIQKGISKAKKQQQIQPYKKNHRRRKLLTAIGSVAAVFTLLIGSSFFSPALASSLSQIPIIGSVFGDSDLIALQRAQENGLTSQIGETQTVDGISITLDEILYDQNNVTVGFHIESEKELPEDYFSAGPDFTINGKMVDSTGSYGENVVTPTTRTAIMTINVNKKTPDDFELGLIAHGKNGESWYFTTPVEKITDLETIPVNHTQKVDGVKINVTELTTSKTGTSLTYESVEESDDFDRSRGGYIEFLMEDQDGNEIAGLSGGVSGELVKNEIHFHSNKQFDPLPENVTTLTITPYLSIPTGGGGVEFDEDGNEIELEFQANKVQPIEFEPFEVNIP